MDATKKDRLLGCWIGLAVGDAVGTTLEFSARDTYEHIIDMVGGGPFRLKPGQWTDDTSMAICLAESILAEGKIDAEDLRERWRDWWKNGTNSSTGRCFDIGSGTAQALRTGRPGGEGNGSIMRLAPVVLRSKDKTRAIYAAVKQSEVTHTGMATDCAALLASALDDLVHDEPISVFERELKWLGSYSEWTPREDISSSGYCVHTLRAALWCLHQTSDFRSAVLLAANLGDDADTVAAVTGQLAGAKYGLSGVPTEWKAKLYQFPKLFAMGEALIAASEG